MNALLLRCVLVVLSTALPLVARAEDPFIEKIYDSRASGDQKIAAAKEAWLQGGATRARLIELATDNTVVARFIAPVAWEALKNGEDIPGLIPLLVQALNENDNGRGEAVAEQIAGPARLPVCEAAVQSKEEMAHSRGAGCLADLTEGDLEKLTHLARHPDALVRLKVVDQLRDRHPEGGAPLLLELMQDKDWKVRMVTAGACLSYPGQVAAAVPLLAAMTAKEKSSDARAEAACALGDIGEVSKPAIPKLIAALKDKAGRVRGCAADALGKLDAVEAVPEMMKILSDERSPVREGLPKALGKLAGRSPGAVDKLVAALSDPKQMENAGEAIAYVEDKEAVTKALPALLKAGTDPKMPFMASVHIWRTVREVWEGAPDDVLAAIKKCLSPPVSCASRAAADVAGAMGPRAREVAPLIQRLIDEHPSALDEADLSGALGRIMRAP